MRTPGPSRRSFLASAGGVLSSAWVALHWREGVAAAHHAEASPAPGLAGSFEFLRADEATQVEAVAAQIIPGGATAGAREARVVHFIDASLTTVFADLAQDFRSQLARFQSDFEAQHPGRGGFAAASHEAQLAHMRTIVPTPFFRTMRFLTVLGFLTSPRYGGNANGLGWKAIGFEDQHVFAPPFGYYDRDYAGFVPYGTNEPR